ncbi:hypothetical protein [Mesorhizobium argentiipisi]|uniref:Uncharacterized protein n=1 Tax=Mesorhizobium argentiipisi TaxID=3015175 RepID=A0ABU8KF30_9HYPH
MKGRRDIELCQQVIAQFYEAEEKVRELRSPMSYPAIESAERPKHDHESENEARLRDTDYVPIARWRSQKDFWKDFFSYKFRMRALFGPVASRPFEKVDEALRTFTAAATVRYESIRGERVELGGDAAFATTLTLPYGDIRLRKMRSDRYKSGNTRYGGYLRSDRPGAFAFANLPAVASDEI